jgi:(p)ppGpp synthase/HD superfamily hydrolase
MKEWIAVLRAADKAARWHVHQRRKGIAQEPYINHLLEVASLVTEATGGTDPNVVIAALLHDAVEDQGVTSETHANEFGQHVADIVMEVTDDKTLPKDERKRRQVENAGKKSREAKLVKLADKTSNLRTIATSPPPIGRSSDGWNMWIGLRRSWLVYAERRRGWNSGSMRLPNGPSSHSMGD